MRKTIIYKAVNDIDDETYEGTGKQLAALIGISHTTINKAALENKKVAGQWIVTRTNNIQEEKTEPDLMQKWDEVTRPLKNSERSRRSSSLLIIAKASCHYGHCVCPSSHHVCHHGGRLCGHGRGHGHIGKVGSCHASGGH